MKKKTITQEVFAVWEVELRLREAQLARRERELAHQAETLALRAEELRAERDRWEAQLRARREDAQA